jgi:predicted aspartyl protease
MTTSSCEPAQRAILRNPMTRCRPLQQVRAICLRAVAWLILCCGYAAAQTVDYEAATRLPPLATDAAVSNPVYAIATQRDRIGRIVAPVVINGQGPFHFMLDTGATRTALAVTLTQRLGLHIDADAQVSVVGVTGSAAVGTVLIDRLTSGALEMTGLRFPVLSGPVLEGLDGILGMDGLNDRRLTADFVLDRLVISVSRNRRAAYGRSVIPVEFLVDRLLLVVGRVGQIKTRIVIDTGGTHTLGNLALYDALIHGNAIRGWEFATSVTDVVDSSQAGTARSVPPLRLGQSVVNNVNVTFGDFRVFHAWKLETVPALLLGMDVIGTLAELTIDYHRQQLEVMPR